MKNQEIAVEGADRVHVEHIYPQSPPATWKADNHDQIIDRLGNLTLLGRPLNQSLANSKFADKRDNEVRGYRTSELKITQALTQEPYSEIEYWTIQEIDERQADSPPKQPRSGRSNPAASGEIFPTAWGKRIDDFFQIIFPPAPAAKIVEEFLEPLRGHPGALGLDVQAGDLFRERVPKPRRRLACGDGFLRGGSGIPLLMPPRRPGRGHLRTQSVQQVLGECPRDYVIDLLRQLRVGFRGSWDQALLDVPGGPP